MDEGSVATDDSVRYQLVHLFAQVDPLLGHINSNSE
jgi:hypothetical protein